MNSTRSLNYTETLDKALYWLRELEIDKALDLLYSLLEQNPRKFELIQQIYQIETKRPQQPGFLKICEYLFAFRSNQRHIHQLIIQAYRQLKQLKLSTEQFSQATIFNLFFHLHQSTMLDDAGQLAEQIKTQFPQPENTNHVESNNIFLHPVDNTTPSTPQALLWYCESLIQHKQYLLAQKELKYLITYYAETSEARNAVGQLKQVDLTLSKFNAL
ncbi:hypothetical protein [Aliikangiella maris]|uniref:Tetratricopeptide repeat protein n=2 Tax=Aliikangiella maris TaxID=3162458 RepID=A0ABV2BVR8_9GAMM